jgi:hypothetical protein
MKKYKQTIIPKVTTQRFQNMSLTGLRRFISDYYKKNYLDGIVENKHKGFNVHFTGKGRRKTAFGEAMYSNKAAAILALDKLVKYGEYNNWGDRKNDDPKELLGYYNLKSFIYIDGKKKCVRLAIQVFKTGDICFNPYYNLEVNK